MSSERKVYTDSENFGTSVVIMLIILMFFISILPISPNAAFCVLMGSLLVYLFKTAVTGRF